MFLSGRGWGSVFKTQVPSKGKEYQCKHCKNKFSSEKTLRTHNKKYHVKQLEPKNSVSQIETKVTEGQKENTEIKADQKTEEMEVDEKVQEKEKDDFTSKEIERLMSIQEKYNETIDNLLKKVSTLEQTKNKNRVTIDNLEKRISSLEKTDMAQSVEEVNTTENDMELSEERAEEPEKFMCSNCEFIGAESKSLQDHQKTVHNQSHDNEIQDDSSWLCKDCSYQTNKESNLRIHI